MVRCGRCGAGYDEEYEFCEDCGEKLLAPGLMRCSDCGETNREGLRFCEYCGASMPPLGPSKPLHPIAVMAANVASGKLPPPSPPQSPSPLDCWQNPLDGLSYVFLPPGRFMMGTRPNDDDHFEERPRHPVIITKGFWMCRTPVTEKAFLRFFKGSGYRWPSGYGSAYSGWLTPDRPASGVPFDTACEYCKWLGGRLPTEAEWEYAARAGTTTDYWWGDTFDEAYAWCKTNAEGKTHPVGQKPPNPWDLYDMFGLVGEWCADQYEPGFYQTSPVEDPCCIGHKDSIKAAIIRGGGLAEPVDLRASARAVALLSRNPDHSFRCVIPVR